MVALLNLDAVEDPADHLAHGLVRIDGDDADLAEVLRPGLGPVEVELVAGDQAIIRADRQLDPPVPPIVSTICSGTPLSSARASLGRSKRTPPSPSGCRACRVVGPWDAPLQGLGCRTGYTVTTILPICWFDSR